MVTTFGRLALASLLAIAWGVAQGDLLGAGSEVGKEIQAQGKSTYDVRCAYCHGLEGKGDAPAASVLNPKPRDFTVALFRFRSTESGSLPVDADLMKTVKNGLPGTSMPAFGSMLKEDEIRSVIAYVKSFSPRFASEKPKAINAGNGPSMSATSVVAGKKVYAKLECASCHGTDGTGADATVKDLIDENARPIAATDLTQPWSFHGGSTARDVFLRMRTGMDGTPMASYKDQANETDMWNLANYVLSLGRRPVWKMTADELKQYYAKRNARKNADPISWGRYLVSMLGCRDCHSPVQPGGALMSGLELAGGQRWELYPWGTLYAPNLTSDKETGLGNITDDQIKNAITRGVRFDGSRMLPFPMPWTNLAGLKGDDLDAIVAYLRTVAPVYNNVPKNESLNIFSYLVGKFRMLILKEQFPAYIHYGNAGTGRDRSIGANYSVKEEQR